MKMADLVAAAQAYDLKMYPRRRSWTRVPDSQVARLLTGASLAHQGKLADLADITDDEQRQASLTSGID